MFYTIQSAQKQIKEPSDNLALKKAIIFIGENASKDQSMGLTNYLNHSDSDVRRLTAWAVSKIGDSSSSNLLIKLLDDSEESVRRNAILSLGQMESKNCFEILKKMFPNSDYYEGMLIVWFLKKLDPKFKKFLVKQLFHKNESIRKRIVKELKELEWKPKLEEELRLHIVTKNWKELKKFDTSIVTKEIVKLQDTDTLLAWANITIGQKNNDVLEGELLNTLTHKDENVRANVYRILAKKNTSEIKRLFKEKFQEETHKNKKNIIQALYSSPEDIEDDLERIYYYLLNEKKEELADLGSKAVIPIIEEWREVVNETDDEMPCGTALEDIEYDCSIASSLDEMTDQKAIIELERYFNDSHLRIRKLAKTSAEQIMNNLKKEKLLESDEAGPNIERSKSEKKGKEKRKQKGRKLDKTEQSSELTTIEFIILRYKELTDYSSYEPTRYKGHSFGEELERKSHERVELLNSLGDLLDSRSVDLLIDEVHNHVWYIDDEGIERTALLLNVSIASSTALGKLKDPKAFHALASFAQNEDWKYIEFDNSKRNWFISAKCAAIDALGDIGDPRAKSILNKLSEHTLEIVSKKAREVLLKIEQDLTEDTLEILFSINLNNSEAKLDFIRKIKQTNVKDNKEILLNLFFDSDYDIMQEIYELLKEEITSEDEEILLNLYNDSKFFGKPIMPIYFVYLLQNIASNKSLPLVLSSLANLHNEFGDYFEFIPYLNILDRIGDKSVVNPIVSFLSEKYDPMYASEETEELYGRALEILNKITDTDDPDTFLNALKSKNDLTREGALHHLSKNFPEVSLELFYQYVEDSNPKIVEIAISGISERLTPDKVDDDFESIIYMLLERKESEIIRRVAYLINYHELELFLIPLIMKLRPTSKRIQEDILTILSKEKWKKFIRDEESAIDLLIEIFPEIIEQYQSKVIDILLGIKSEKTLNFFKSCLDCRFQYAPEAAIEGLSFFEREQIEDFLVRELLSRSPRLGKKIAEVLEQKGWQPSNTDEKIRYYLNMEQWEELAKFQEQLLPHITDFLIPSDSKLVVNIIKLLENLDSDEKIDILTTILDETRSFKKFGWGSKQKMYKFDLNARVEALNVLGKSRNLYALINLISLYSKERISQFKEKMFSVICELIESDSSFLKDSSILEFTLLLMKDSKVKKRIFATNILAKIVDPDVLESLSDLLKDKDQSVVELVNSIIKEETKSKVKKSTIQEEETGISRDIILNLGYGGNKPESLSSSIKILDLSDRRILKIDFSDRFSLFANLEVLILRNIVLEPNEFSSDYFCDLDFSFLKDLKKLKRFEFSLDERHTVAKYLWLSNNPFKFLNQSIEEVSLWFLPNRGIFEIPKLKDLKILKLDTIENYEILLNLNNLKELYLSSIEPEFLEIIDRFSNLQKLTVKDIRCYEYEGIEKRIQELLENKSIEDLELHLSSKGIDSDFVLKSSSITKLKLVDSVFKNQITIENSPELTKLVLEPSRLNSIEFKEKINYPKMEELRIKAAKLKNLLIPSSCKFPELKELSIECVQLEKPRLAFLASMPKLEKFYLKNKFISICDKLPLENSLNLKELNIRGIEIGQDEFDLISQLKHLEYVRFSFKGVDLLDLKILSQHKKLKTIIIKGKMKVVDLRAIKDLENLEILTIRCDQEIKISTENKWLKLKKLSLACNRNELDLTPFKRCEKLEEIDLSSNYNIHTLDLTPLENCKKLKRIFLIFCDKLVTIKGSKELKRKIIKSESDYLLKKKSDF